MNGDCSSCTGLCCRYVMVPLDAPETPKAYDWLRYIIAHEGLIVTRDNDDNDWQLYIPSRCHYLAEDNRCMVYEARPVVCRQYSTEDCDQTVDETGYDAMTVFDTPEKIEAEARSELGDVWLAWILKQAAKSGCDISDKTPDMISQMRTPKSTTNEGVLMQTSGVALTVTAKKGKTR